MEALASSGLHPARAPAAAGPTAAPGHAPAVRSLVRYCTHSLLTGGGSEKK